MKNFFRYAWRLWALSLGERASDDNREADMVALIRTIFAFINLGTCILIGSNILIGWEVL
mgnify:CR=1 FL=1